MVELHLKRISDAASLEAYRRDFPDWLAGAAKEVPDYMLPGLARWIMWGIYPGGFMQAVIRNDLKDAAGRADENNQRRFGNWVIVMVNYVPSEAQGSEQAMFSWNARGGVLGRCQSCGQPLNIPEDLGSMKVPDGICRACEAKAGGAAP